MNTAEILDYTISQDIQLSVEDGNLHVDAPKGAITPQLRLVLCQHKQQVISWLLDLYEAVRPSELSVSEVYNELSEDGRAEFIAGDISIVEIKTFAMSIANRRLREQGKIPAHYNSITECQHCGTVPIWEGAPVKVLSCVWCLNRVSGRPMPST